MTETKANPPAGPMRWLWRGLAILCIPVLVAAALWAGVLVYSALLPGGYNFVERGTAEVDWLPVAANRVSRYRAYGVEFVEHIDCALPLADMEAFAAAQGWSGEEAEDAPVEFGADAGYPERVGRARVYTATTSPRRLVYDLGREWLYIDNSPRPDGD